VLVRNSVDTNSTQYLLKPC